MRWGCVAGGAEGGVDRDRMFSLERHTRHAEAVREPRERHLSAVLQVRTDGC